MTVQDPTAFRVWNPKRAGEPQERSGKLVGTGKYVDAEGVASLVLRLEARDAGAPFALVVFDAILKSQLAELRPALALGDELHFTYSGKKPLRSDSAKSANRWTVERKGDTPGIDLGLLGVESVEPAKSDIPGDLAGIDDNDPPF